MTRTVNCDFCNAILVDHAWDCGAESFDYSEPRIGVAPWSPVIEGSLGSWIACDTCAALVRDGKRDALVGRAVGALPAQYRTIAREDVRGLHDQFWAHRAGQPRRIGRDQLALIASEPRFNREWRPGSRPR